MGNQTVVEAAAAWQGLFNTLTKGGTELDFTKTGEVYFVDANFGIDTNSGLDWEHPFETLKYAITVSNANIARGKAGYASRNKIYIKGDKVVENLVIAPSKCDVIGCGSNDGEDKTHIQGKQIFTQSGTNMGMGWYNLTFSNSGAEAIFAVTNVGGLYFGGCDFVARNDSIHAIHLIGTTGHDFRVDNCRIINDEYGDQFATAGILIATTATFWNLLIKKSYVEGEIGIKIDTTDVNNGVIDDCKIKAVGLCIDDDSDDVVIINNRWITTGEWVANSVDYNKYISCGNIGTGKSGGSFSSRYFPDMYVKIMT